LKSELLEVENLKTNFYTYEGVVKALDEISFSLNSGDTLGIVGETGCGKSVTVLSIMKLIVPPGKIEKGRVLYNTESEKLDLMEKDELFMQKIRGNEISMIFQEASSALNPVLSVKQQVTESFLLHRQRELCEKILEVLDNELKHKRGITRLFTLLQRWNYKRKLPKCRDNTLKPGHYGRLLQQEATRLSIELLRSLGIPNPEQVIKRYPHELSGGMQQRIVISMALACNPGILIADEPTSNLDVTIQAQILELIEKLKTDYKSSILFITHDLGVVSEVANKVIVLYAGTMVEFAEVRELFKNPLHPYTRALLNSIPALGKRKRLESIKGNVPNLVDPPAGCRFHPRCPHVMDICRNKKPGIYRKKNPGSNHLVACFLYLED